MDNESSRIDEGLATIEEAAAFLSISRGVVYKLLEAGSIPSLKIGRARRIKWSSLREFIESCPAA